MSAQTIIWTILECGIVLVGIVVLIYLIKKKGRIDEGSKWGINLAGNLKCPICECAVPRIRKPQNTRQAMWGGWTCKGCGTELDKWLKPIPKNENGA